MVPKEIQTGNFELRLSFVRDSIAHYHRTSSRRIRWLSRPVLCFVHTPGLQAQTTAMRNAVVLYFDAVQAKQCFQPIIPC